MDQMRDELQYSDVKGKNPFKDIRVRQALYHAIDIDAIRSRIMRGLRPVSCRRCFTTTRRLRSSSWS